MPYIIAPLVAAFLAAAPELPFEARFKAVAASNPGVAQLSQIGRSRLGRPIHVLRLADPGEGAAELADRPALLVIAGVNGQHRVGVETAVGLAEKIAADHRDLLAAATVYVVPCVNPDGLAWHLDAGHPKIDYSRSIVPTDADRDGRVGEDGAEDLNGDGVVTMMRIASPGPGTGLRAEYAADADEPRVLKKADPAKGERPVYAVLIEGTDEDGDGLFNEDGVGGSAGGGVDLDRNTPYRWPEGEDGAGTHGFSEPETEALGRWMLAHSDIAAVLVYGPHDTLVNVPPAGRYGADAQVPVGIEEGDKAVYEEISKVFKDITRMTGAPSVDSAGSVHGWAYGHYGVYSFSTPVWVRPDLIKAEDDKKEGDDEEKPEGEQPAGEPDAAGEMTPDQIQATIARFTNASEQERGRMMAEFQQLPPAAQARIMETVRGTQPEAGGGRGGGRRGGLPGGRGGQGGQAGPGGGGEKAAGTDDVKWLKYSDEKRDGAGFIPWTPFDHPQLGPVEIGGFVPGFKLNPPDEELPRLLDEQARFVVELIKKLPRVDLADGAASAERLAPGLWRVRLRLTNEGYFPTVTTIGARTRRMLPTLLTIDTPAESILAGDKIQRRWGVAGTGTAADADWIIRADDGATVAITVRPTHAAERTVQITLEEAPR